jgi:hypothetical protein
MTYSLIKYKGLSEGITPSEAFFILTIGECDERETTETNYNQIV